VSDEPKPKFPPDTSWDLSGSKRRLRDRRTWGLFAVIFCMAGPAAGFAAFWAAFAAGMRAFGPSYAPSLLDGVVWLFTHLPVPHRQSDWLMIVNAVLWAAAASLLAAMRLSGRGKS
jgi:hypothetical protein